MTNELIIRDGDRKGVAASAAEMVGASFTSDSHEPARRGVRQFLGSGEADARHERENVAGNHRHDANPESGGERLRRERHLPSDGADLIIDYIFNTIHHCTTLNDFTEI